VPRKTKKEVNDLFDEMIEQFSEIHNEWEINNLKILKDEYNKVETSLDWHETHFNG